MKVSFRGREYDVHWLKRNIPVDGEITEIGKNIYINAASNPKNILETEIHESLHACLTDFAEEAITQTAASITDLLWRRGYRRKR